jgi:2-pyrone-4,6-dicarboxylate lactonase
MHACPGPDRNTKRPAFQLPHGACDCHVHVFGPQAAFPFSPDRSYTPEDCTLEDLEKLHAILGVDRVVIVHGGAHGTDNSATLAALDRRPDRMRGVAVVPSGLPRKELEDMHRRGMRGCRMSTVVSGGASFAHLDALAEETFDLGWHLVLHFGRAEALVEVARRPDRIIWGSNWPHPICPTPMPNDGDLVDLIPLWLPDEKARQFALVDNPAKLYGFGPVSGG